jgi:hypothetical protein
MLGGGGGMDAIMTVAGAGCCGGGTAAMVTPVGCVYPDGPGGGGAGMPACGGWYALL